MTSIALLTAHRETEEAMIVTITPTMASALLASSPGNRRIRPWYVSLLAGAMKRGEWCVTSQGVGIDRLGRLRDAHHRLNACVSSGVPLRTVIVAGLSDDAYAVTDTGIMRTLDDRLAKPRDVAEVLRLGAQFVHGTAKPTAAQIRPIDECGLGDAAEAITLACNTRRKFYSSAPMRFAAAVSCMGGADSEYVLGQYRALCHQDYDAMSSASKSLSRQVNALKGRNINPRESFARGLKVFDADRKNLTRVQVSEPEIAAAIEYARSVLTRAMMDAESAE